MADPNETPDPDDLEKTARAEGWVPESEWHGEPPKHGFMTAADYVERGKTVIPILNSKLRKRDEELQSLRAEVEGIRQTAQQFQHFAQNAVEKERREKEQVLSQLEERRAQAISEGDGRLAVAAERQIAEIRQAPVPHYQAPDPQANAIVQGFLNRNPWYTDNPVMRSWAEGRSRELLANGVQPGNPVLGAIESEVKQAFPERFSAGPNGGGSYAGVESGGRRANANGRAGRTFDDLPPEAKQAFEQFKRLGVRMSRDQYLSNYEWE